MTTPTTTQDLRQNIAKTAPMAGPPVQIGFFDSQGFELAQRIANMFSTSNLVPQRYRGNLGSCVIALNMAARIGADPMMVMQNLYEVHGTPSWSAQFLIATFNACGRFSSLRYEFEGEEGTDEWKCRAWSVEKSTNERLNGSWVSIGLAKKEKWYEKSGSKWQTMPQQMLQYRSAAWFVRAYAPEIAMGMQTVEEVNDTWDMKQESPGVYSVTSEELKTQQLEASTQEEQGQPAPPRTINYTTRADMQAKRENTKAELEEMGVFDQVAAEMGRKGQGPWKAWDSAKCQKALDLGKAMLEVKQQPQAQDAPMDIICPNLDGAARPRTDCDACASKGECPMLQE